MFGRPPGWACLSHVQAREGVALWGPDLIEVPLLPVQEDAGRVGAFQVKHQFIHFPLEPLLGFLQGGTLGAHCLCVFLCFLEPLGQFFPKRTIFFFFFLAKVNYFRISELSVDLGLELGKTKT